MSNEVEINGLLCRFEAGEDARAPLLYLVHGRAGTVDVMWAFRRCFPTTFNVVSVQAPKVDAIGGYSWWHVEPEPEGFDAALNASELLLRFGKVFEEEYALTPSVRLALGFSQGAVLLSLALQAQAHFFHGVGLLAGFVLEHPKNSDFVASEVKPEVFQAHGTKDTVVPMDRALASFHLLESWGCEVDFHQDAVGHKIGSSAMRALKDWLQSYCS